MNNLPAAGIIPYVILNGSLFYLLGKEKSTKKWSGFIGNTKDSDISIPHTAIREFNEETCLLYSDYLPTITKLVNNTEPVIIKNKRKNIYIYFIEFPSYFFNNSTTYQFYKNKLSNINNPEYLEKLSLAWFTKKSIEMNNNVIHSLKLIIYNST